MRQIFIIFFFIMICLVMMVACIRTVQKPINPLALLIAGKWGNRKYVVSTQPNDTIIGDECDFNQSFIYFDPLYQLGTIAQYDTTNISITNTCNLIDSNLINFSFLRDTTMVVVTLVKPTFLYDTFDFKVINSTQLILRSYKANKDTTFIYSSFSKVK